MSAVPLDYRKQWGQYMTPQTIADEAVGMLQINPSGAPIIIDPAVGTGELLLAAARATVSVGEGVQLIGFDADVDILLAAERNLQAEGVDASLYNYSLFSEDWRGFEGMVDYVIVNPPYFEIMKSDERLKSINDFSLIHGKGRLNIYALFFEYCFKLLKNHGQMVLIVPPSMNNGAYFKLLRQHIIKNGVIQNLKLLTQDDLFQDALTSAQMMVIQKTNSNFTANFEASSPFLYGDEDSFIITPSKKFLTNYWKGKKSLEELGFIVRTGNIQWDKHKDTFIPPSSPNLPPIKLEKLLNAENSQQIPLIYSRDITTHNTLSFSPKINSQRRLLPPMERKMIVGPAIIINRVVGSLSSPMLRAAFIEKNIRFYGENHLNIVTLDDLSLSKEEQESELLKLFYSFTHLDPHELGRYLQALTGNTQISQRELLTLLPMLL